MLKRGREIVHLPPFIPMRYNNTTGEMNNIDRCYNAMFCWEIPSSHVDTGQTPPTNNVSTATLTAQQWLQEPRYHLPENVQVTLFVFALTV